MPVGPAPPASSGSEEKVLLVFVDGFIPEALDTSETPTLDGLIQEGAWSRSARAKSTTISGSGWSTFLTGVHWDKHRVPDNDFAHPEYTKYPHVFARIREVQPGAVVGGCQSWEPIESGLVEPSKTDFGSFHDYYEYSKDYWDEASADALCARDVIAFAARPDVDVLAVMFGEIDGVAHKRGYGADFETYQRMLTRIDGYIGQIQAAIRARPTFGDERWLTIVTTERTRSIRASAGAPSRSPVAQRTVFVERVWGGPPQTPPCPLARVGVLLSSAGPPLARS